jgi:hypothetical protein
VSESKTGSYGFSFSEGFKFACDEIEQRPRPSQGAPKFFFESEVYLADSQKMGYPDVLSFINYFFQGATKKKRKTTR